MPASTADTLDAIARTAHAWRDPEHPPRAAAVKKTLAADNRFTEEALAFAINQTMDRLRQKGMRAWAGEKPVAAPRDVAVRVPGRVPMDGLRDVLAVVLTGHRARVYLPERSPELLPAFLGAVASLAGALPVVFAEGALEEADTVADALIATPADAEAHADVLRDWEAQGKADERAFVRPVRFGIGVMDGEETEEDCENLAEDIFLHEGLARRSIRLLFAPADADAHAMFEAFAVFRGVFPAHPATAGALAMQKAFLDAAKLPHVHGDGLEFLVSRGAADVQGPGHLRWVVYDHLAEVQSWLRVHAAEVNHVAVSEAVARQLSSSLPSSLSSSLPLAAPGHAHRPGLDADADVVDFLRGL